MSRSLDQLKQAAKRDIQERVIPGKPESAPEPQFQDDPREDGFKGTRKTVPDSMKLKQRNFRMSDRDWNQLVRHFEAKGLTIAQGIRLILREYMTRENIR